MKTPRFSQSRAGAAVSICVAVRNVYSPASTSSPRRQAREHRDAAVAHAAGLDVEQVAAVRLQRVADVPERGAVCEHDLPVGARAREQRPAQSPGPRRCRRSGARSAARRRRRCRAPAARPGWPRAGTPGSGGASGKLWAGRHRSGAVEQLLAAVDVEGGAGEGRVRHEVDGERGDVRGPDDAADRQPLAQLGRGARRDRPRAAAPRAACRRTPGRSGSRGSGQARARGSRSAPASPP